MRSPAKELCKQFLHQSPTTLLIASVTVALLDFLLLYASAEREGVLRIDRGVGLLNNFGLVSTLVGNGISLYVARKYYDSVNSAKSSKAVLKKKPIEDSISTLTAMIRLEGRHQWLYLFLVIGTLAWISNVSWHLFGNPQARWGHLVFDSTDHPFSFTASRLHNAYTWIVIMPFVAHILISSTLQLRQAIEEGLKTHALAYDLLNPDQRGGFLFVDKASIAFNMIVAVVYFQIVMHIVTFQTITIDHVLGIGILTLLLLGGNRMFLGDIYAGIRTLRLESLNERKQRVYENDKLSFEILKYCYERKITETAVINWCIKGGAIILPGLLKYWPLISKALRPVLGS